MNVDEATIRELCPDAVFERGQRYREEGRIRRLDRFETVVTATVQGSSLYDVAAEFDGDTIDGRCTCPYDGPGECKHVVAVVLDTAGDPPRDESDRVEAVLDDVAATDLRAFVRETVARNPDLRERFFARFGEESRPVDAYRDEIQGLFDQHTEDYPVVTTAIDFSHFFDLADQYRDRGRYGDAIAVYRALFEEIDDNETRIDGAYDYYASALQSALDGYIECVRAADLATETVEEYAGVLESRASSGPGANSEQFRRALDDLERE
jgi:uncharacterized Zn finger protein